MIADILIITTSNIWS